MNSPVKISNPLVVVNDCISFIEKIKQSCREEYNKIEFFKTTTEYLGTYKDEIEEFEELNCNEGSIKAIINTCNLGIAVAYVNNKIVGYARFCNSDFLTTILPEKTYKPIELAELYVLPKFRDQKIGKKLFRTIIDITDKIQDINSIILSVSQERNIEYNLVDKYYKMGCNVCYLHLDNKPENRAKASAIPCNESVPEKRDVQGYILLRA